MSITHRIAFALGVLLPWVVGVGALVTMVAMGLGASENSYGIVWGAGSLVALVGMMAAAEIATRVEKREGGRHA